MDNTDLATISVAIISFLCAAGVVVGFLLRRQRLQTWIQVEATVYRAWTERQGDGGITHRAEYIFETHDGQKRQGKGRTRDAHQADDVIDVWYDPADPYRSKASFADGKTWYIAGGAAVFMFVAIGALALLDALDVIDLS